MPAGLLRGLLLRGLAFLVRPVEVLQDSPRVMDHLVAVDEDGYTPLAGQLLDLGPRRPRAGGTAPARPGSGARVRSAVAQPRRTGRARWSGSGSGRGRAGRRRASMGHGPRRPVLAARSSGPHAARSPHRAREHAESDALGASLATDAIAELRPSARRPPPRASPRAGRGLKPSSLLRLRIAIGPPQRAGADLVARRRGLQARGARRARPARAPRRSGSFTGGGTPEIRERSAKSRSSVKLRALRM